jgi:hypothetical protein
MADFCHDLDPGGLGCGAAGHDETKCPKPCLGEFQWALTDATCQGLTPGYEVNLGICEGHGTVVFLTCDDEGKFWFEHGPGDIEEGAEGYPIPEKKEVTFGGSRTA